MGNDFVNPLPIQIFVFLALFSSTSSSVLTLCKIQQYLFSSDFEFITLPTESKQPALSTQFFNVIFIKSRSFYFLFFFVD